MNIKRKVTITLVSLMTVVAVNILISLVLANHREVRILNIHIGSNRFEVEHYLGEGKPNDTHGDEKEWFTYKGNPSLWFGRLEDSVIVCYSNNAVAEIYRIGL